MILAFIRLRARNYLKSYTRTKKEWSKNTITFTLLIELPVNEFLDEACDLSFFIPALPVIWDRLMELMKTHTIQEERE